MGKQQVQLAGYNTVLVDTWPLATKKSCGLSQSYGHKVCTNPALACENGTGHHRITDYVSPLTHPPRVHIH